MCRVIKCEWGLEEKGCMHFIVFLMVFSFGCSLFIWLVCWGRPYPIIYVLSFWSILASPMISTPTTMRLFGQSSRTLSNWEYQVHNHYGKKTILGSNLLCKWVIHISGPWFWVADTFSVSAFIPYLSSLTSQSLFATILFVITTKDCGLDITNPHLAGWQQIFIY